MICVEQSKLCNPSTTSYTYPAALIPTSDMAQGKALSLNAAQQISAARLMPAAQGSSIDEIEYISSDGTHPSPDI